MNAQDYDNKMFELLEDPAYKMIPIDKTKEIEKAIKTELTNLKKKKRINQKTLYSLNPNHSRAPIFYGLPKIHKDGIPLRPICDFRKSPSYKLAHYLNQILKTITSKSPYTLKNTYEYAQQIKNYEIHPDEILVSFDVKSLFTIVPTTITIQYIGERLNSDDEWKTMTSLTTTNMIDLITLCTKSNYFKFKDLFFEQIIGTPMGSPISPVFAEFFMQLFESKTVVHLKQIHFYRRYVDDTSTIIDKDSLDEIHQVFNSFHPSLQFTYEEETDGHLPFLDIDQIRGNDGKIKRKVYRKKTHTGRYLNYSSYHHPSHKISVIDALLYRAFIISDDEYLEEEIKHVENSLVKNGYPLSLIKSRIERMRTRSQVQNQVKSDPNKRMILPYMGPITHHLTSFLRRKLDCDFGFIPGLKVGQQICSHKQKEPPEKIGVYRIPCKQPCNSIYIGETLRPLELRLKEHKNDIINKKETSALACHIMSNPTHEIDIESATLIVSEPRYFHRKFKESLNIRKASTRMNRDLGMDINPIWTSLLLPLTSTPQ
jgi:hypothetical protein